MKAPSILVVALSLALGLVVGAQERQVVPLRAPVVQPLLGVGNAPPSTPPAASPDAFFDDNVLQEIRLTMNSRDWQTLKDNYLDNTYYPTDFKWRDQTVRNVGIRSRGNGSRSGIKPGLRVDFDRYTGSKRFLGLKSFVLRNNTQDPSNMHERVSMLLFRRMGAPAPREAHTRMFVNDVYAGLFTIVESVDKEFLKRTFNEDTGFLFKYDYPPDQQPYRFEDKGSDPAQYVPLPFKPETHETDARPEFVVQLVQTINTASDANFKSAVGEYLDLSHFMRHVAVEVFVGDYDGFIGNYGVNNFYFYRFDNQKRFEFIAWDKSEGFQAGPTSSIFHNINDVSDSLKNKLMTRVLSFADLHNQFMDTLVQVARSSAEPAAGDARGWMEREIEREYSQIRDAARADTDKPYSNDAFEAAVVALSDFARRRSDIVTAEANASRR